MTDIKQAHAEATHGPHPKITELVERLAGTWQVKGHEINGMAKYAPQKGGYLLVQDVDFIVSGVKMKIMQHIAYDQTTDTLQAHYMDTLGDDSTYTWVLDGNMLRVSHGEKESDTYFKATFNKDFSEYVGTWHYPDSKADDTEQEQIIYQRIEEADS